MTNLCYLGFNLESHINIKYCLTGKNTKKSLQIYQNICTQYKLEREL